MGQVFDCKMLYLDILVNNNNNNKKKMSGNCRELVLPCKIWVIEIRLWGIYFH